MNLIFMARTAQSSRTKASTTALYYRVYENGTNEIERLSLTQIRRLRTQHCIQYARLPWQ